MRSGQRDQTQFLFRYALQSLGFVVILAILMRAFVFSSYVMSGSAMLPTIWPGDFLLASKLRTKDLKRGDVVAMRCPLTKDKLCLKRVVGLPGDRIEFLSGGLLINGQAAHYRSLGAFQTEIIAGGSWPIWPDQSGDGGAGVAAAAAVVVPPQSVYLLSDKRSDRDDSRHWGPVANDVLEARVLRVWMSLDWYQDGHIRNWPRVRWARLMRSID